MRIICSECGRDINALGQDNVSYTNNPICQDCFYYLANSHSLVNQGILRSMYLEGYGYEKKS
jgi:NMD protein affecting ribosome stability and mRNA decay